MTASLSTAEYLFWLSPDSQRRDATPDSSVDLLTTELTELDRFYGELRPALSSQLKTTADAINASKQLQAEIIVDIGLQLIKAKEKLEHGQFGWWIRAACDFTHRSAQNYMAVAEHFGTPDKLETVSHLKAQTLYALSAPQTPHETRRKLLKALSLERDRPSDKKILYLIKVERENERRRSIFEDKFGHLPPEDQRIATIKYFGALGTERRKSEHRMNIRLLAFQRLYFMLRDAPIDTARLIQDLTEAEIPYLPKMLLEGVSTPPGLEGEGLKREQDNQGISGNGE